MTDQKKLEVIEEAFNYYHDRTSLTRLEEKELTDFVYELKEAISVTRCSLQLKDKKAPTFEHWLICNFEETKSGKYIDFNNGDNYRDKEVLKLKYNKIFKPTL